MDATYRIVIIGNAYVGKTSLVMRCIHQQFSTNYEGTIGASFFTYNAKISQSLFPNASSQELSSNKYITIPFQLWDTAGTEKYRSLAPIYYKNASAAIFVYDVSDRNSFDDLEQWVAAFKDSCANINSNEISSDLNTSGCDSESSLAGSSNNVNNCRVPLYLVGNKNDLADRIAVTNQEGEKWASDHHFQFMSTSAVTGDNVDLLFSKVANDIIAIHNRVSTVNQNDIRSLTDTEFNCC